MNEARRAVARAVRGITCLTLLLTVGKTLPGSQTAVASPALRCTGRWVLDAGAGPGVYNALYGVDALSTTDVWAVGATAYVTLTGLIEHWDGSAWRSVPNPTPGTRRIHFVLKSVEAVRSSDVWAVGVAADVNTGNRTTLIEHWDGSSWQIVQRPKFGDTSDQLTGVSAVSPSDVWAVGNTDYQQPLIEHWNGDSWSVVDSPRVRPGGTLADVSAVARDDVWAVGYRETSHSSLKQLIEHWNGHVWRILPTRFGGDLEGVSASDADHVWGVGTSVLDWNGRTWKQVENPQLGDLVAVSAPAFNDAWAVGTHSHSVDPRQVYSEHWDGSHWSLVHMRQPAGTGFDEVNDVTSVSSQAWAVGRSGNPDGNGTLIEHFC